jgi:ribosomal protein S18 acetylase RimI-like enzyme
MPSYPADPIRIDDAAPDAEGVVGCLSAYAALLAARVPGLVTPHAPSPFDARAEASMYRPPSGACLLATRGGQAVACVMLKTVEPGFGEVKRLWVDPSARGQGLARRMMAAIEDRARAMGMTALRLDTNENLPEAIALYRATGWVEVEPFTDYPATHWFRKAL